MIDSYRLDEVRHSREDRKHLATFVTLDGCELGLDIQWELRGLRFTIFRKHKRDKLATTRWISFASSQETMYNTLYELVLDYYREHGKTIEDNGLPTFTRIELRVPISHLHFHINAGTLSDLLQKEIIYN